VKPLPKKCVVTHTPRTWGGCDAFLGKWLHILWETNLLTSTGLAAPGPQTSNKIDGYTGDKDPRYPHDLYPPASGPHGLDNNGVDLAGRPNHL